MKKEHIKPSDEFRDDVERALKLSSQKEMRDALIKVCEKYGHFWAREIHLGGLIIKDEEDHKETNVQSTGGKIGAAAELGTTPIGIGAGIKLNNGALNQNLFSNSKKNSIVVGGCESIYTDKGINSL